MAKIDIIIPIFNSELYLRRCLDSVLEQPYKDIRLILVNDGSIDASKQICEEYVCVYNNVFLINKRNGGVSSARNIGLDNVTADWVMFIDSDDWLEHNTLTDNFVSYLRDCVDLVEFPFNRCGRRIEKKVGLYATRSELDFFIANYFNNELWARVYNKTTLSNLRFEESLRIGEDVFFLISFYNKCKSIQSINNGEYHYFINESSVMRIADNFVCEQEKNKLFNLVESNNLLSSIGAFSYYAKYIDYIINSKCAYKHFMSFSQKCEIGFWRYLFSSVNFKRKIKYFLYFLFNCI